MKKRHTGDGFEKISCLKAQSERWRETGKKLIARQCWHGEGGEKDRFENISLEKKISKYFKRISRFSVIMLALDAKQDTSYADQDPDQLTNCILYFYFNIFFFFFCNNRTSVIMNLRTCIFSLPKGSSANEEGGRILVLVSLFLERTRWTQDGHWWKSLTRRTVY